MSTQTTSTSWAVCYCTDGQHTQYDHEAWNDERAKPMNTLTFYEPTGHLIEQQTIAAVRVVAVGAASPLIPATLEGATR